MNATIILSAVMTMATSVASITNFAYNSEVNNGKVESQTVYKVENKLYLQPHLKYNYTYDTQNRLIQKEVLRWSEGTAQYEKNHCLNITYGMNETSIEYATWNAQTEAYSNIKEKSVYHSNEIGMPENYQSYKWNKQQNDWNLNAEHSILSWEDALMAMR